MHDHAFGVGQQHAAAGAAQRGFQARDLVAGGAEQQPVAAERGVQPAARDGVEGHRLVRAAVGAHAAGPRLDHRLADQARGPLAAAEETLARQRHALPGRGEEGLRRQRVGLGAVLHHPSLS